MSEFDADMEFADPGVLIDGDLTLQLAGTSRADQRLGFLPVYRFTLLRTDSVEELGGINLRVGYTLDVELYRGNIGFFVQPAYRGNRYAARACRLLVPLIRFHRLNPVWLTCSYDNIASQKTIEALGAHFLETRDVPDDWPYIQHYPANERRKRRYRWDP